MSDDAYTQSAFRRVCKRAKTPESWYVTLMERIPYYGGPEEGGWWGQYVLISEYQKFPTRELARTAFRAVKRLARRMTRDARRVHGDHCLRETEWLEERGMEPTDLPEPDGATEYYVVCSRQLPTECRERMRYE